MWVGNELYSHWTLAVSGDLISLYTRYTCQWPQVTYFLSTVYREISLGKKFAKPRLLVLQKNFTRYIFAHMRLGGIKFHGIIDNHSFQHGSLAVLSSLEKCLATAKSPISLAILTSVHYLRSFIKALSSPL